MKKLINKALSKILRPAPKEETQEQYFKDVPDDMENITEHIEPQLLNIFKDKLEVFTNYVNYVFALDNKVVFWGNVDDGNVLTTVRHDIIMYPISIQEGINEFKDGDKYVPDMLKLIPELFHNIKAGNVDIGEKIDENTLKIKFKSTKINKE